MSGFPKGRKVPVVTIVQTADRALVLCTNRDAFAGETLLVELRDSVPWPQGGFVAP